MIAKIIRALWIGATVFVLAVTLYAFDGKPDSDIGIFFAWCMLPLSFPGGLLVSLAHVALYDFFSVTIETSYLSFVLDWIGFLILGYLQWFKLVPYLISKLRGSKKM
ncbi:MAG: hypothetical protein BM485_02365 [Desulfobulbaceae bacterium DB1]|nr:MAG: hypothetical protein BM485_02365 [Desulfobulbaceae bacterium DB1]